mmetsp:Transcript_8586/g.26054  ORF Transcript_8586/g.26054 Transcript_8586/m.26054 type:complete len:229 (+) Transcript_8586:67-753(+)
MPSGGAAGGVYGFRRWSCLGLADFPRSCAAPRAAATLPRSHIPRSLTVCARAPCAGRHSAIRGGRRGAVCPRGRPPEQASVRAARVLARRGHVWQGAVRAPHPGGALPHERSVLAHQRAPAGRVRPPLHQPVQPRGRGPRPRAGAHHRGAAPHARPRGRAHAAEPRGRGQCGSVPPCAGRRHCVRHQGGPAAQPAVRPAHAAAARHPARRCRRAHGRRAGGRRGGRRA